ncbi:hypothetical protein [Microtetraspora malaysiensis]|uniref:hypothetical protein n=1 Tax=Microtetraspora malaysiensis TaxID=161358 RepID=UPI003D933A06
MTVTADARTAPVEQPMSGYLVAKDTGDAGIEVSTPLGLEKESEKYELTIKHLDRTGDLASDHSTILRRLDDPNGRWRMIRVNGAGGVATVRVPKGVWEISSFVQDGEQTAYLVHPGLRVQQAQTLEVDARLSRPLVVGLPVSSAVPDWAAVSYGGPLVEGTAVGQQLIAERLDQILTAQIGPSPTTTAPAGVRRRSSARPPSCGIPTGRASCRCAPDPPTPPATRSSRP